MVQTSTTICTYNRSLHGGFNRNIIKFADQRFDNFFILFDNNHQQDISEVKNAYQNNTVFFYTNKDFEDNYFNKPIDRKHRWGNHQNPNYFYAHFRMLLFYLNNKDFDYYWFFDDDVNFNGDLKLFLQTYDSYNDDFIAIQAFKKEHYNNFDRISILNNRMKGSHGNWLNYCPGPGDNFLNTKIHIGSFFPIVRFSNKALAYLYELNLQNYFGYSECFVPTSLASNGYSVSSMLDEFDNFFIPNNTNCKLSHKGINFTWSWL